MNTHTPLWIIEGFYGQPWSSAARGHTLRKLGQWGFDGYIYAPKADRSLRREWARPFSADEQRALAKLANTAHNASLTFGVGLSPFEIWRDWSSATRKLLTSKLSALADSGCDQLSLLFDDVRGDVDNLAIIQVEIARFALEHWPGDTITLCPTYYSDDPVLAQVFGPPPKGYLETLGRNLPKSIDVFWTGPNVLSTALTDDHLSDVANRLGRKPVIWDNYPANDGAKSSRFLFLKGAEEREPALRGLANSYVANPMVQPYLSQLPLYAIASLAREPSSAFDAEAALREAAYACAPNDVAELLIHHADTFVHRGLDGIEADERRRLIEAFASYDDPYAREVAAWLCGAYTFDPECLTD